MDYMIVINEVVLALKQAAINHGDAAVQLTLAAASLNAMQHLIDGVVLLMISLITGCTARKTWKKAGKLEAKDHEWCFSLFLVCGVTTLAMIIFLVAGVGNLSSARAWVGLSKPEIYIATGVLNRMTEVARK